MDISEDRLREIVRQELAPKPQFRPIPLSQQQTEADQLAALTQPGQAADYRLDWASASRRSYFENEQAMASHEASMRAAFADMAFPAGVGGSVATMLYDELSRIPQDALGRQLWEHGQQQALARIVGAANVEAAEAAGKELAARIKDADYRAELEGSGAFKSATWTAQAWLQSRRLAARTGR
jgi:hypothetical protein